MTIDEIICQVCDDATCDREGACFKKELAIGDIKKIIDEWDGDNRRRLNEYLQIL